jgi:uncharacterized damage-inducible protein DinB
MIALMQSHFAHMAWADHSLLKAVAAKDGAFDDEELRKWLHHIVVVERFFLSLLQAHPFNEAAERAVPASIEEMKQRFEEAHADGHAYTARLDEAELARTITFPVQMFKDFHPTVSEALTQVAMHGEHHRAQVAMRLRALGGTPTNSDYILWVRDIKGR